MRYNLVAWIVGRVIILIGFALIVPLGVALYFHEGEAQFFFYAAVITLLAGFFLSYRPYPKGEIRRREGYVIVALSWLAASFFGCLPYLFAGTFNGFADAFFETISGFTTTGASVMTDIEVHSHCILFWRSMTQWLGGMGIVVLFVALLSQLGISGMQMFQAEVPGAVKEKVKPRIRETAKVMWLTYVILSLAETILLLFGGMSLYEAVLHTFTTMSTGGFSPKNASIGFYESSFIQWIIIIFMFLGGTNFALYYQALRQKNPFCFWRNTEFKFYVLIIIGAGAAIVTDLFLKGYAFGESLIRQAMFQVVSILTTTGFVTADFDIWPNFSRFLLLVLMFIGGCYGSTGGSIKVGRILVLIKNGAAELYRAINPHTILPVRLSGSVIVKETLALSILQFFSLYAMIFVIGTLLLLFLAPLDVVSAASAVAATQGNVGPGLGAVGPLFNYAHLPASAKYLLSGLMLVGRLEIYTILVLFLPATWKK